MLNSLIIPAESKISWGPLPWFLLLLCTDPRHTDNNTPIWHAALHFNCTWRALLILMVNVVNCKTHTCQHCNSKESLMVLAAEIQWQLIRKDRVREVHLISLQKQLGIVHTFVPTRIIKASQKLQSIKEVCCETPVYSSPSTAITPSCWQLLSNGDLNKRWYVH